MSDVLDALCFEGKTISISATITNTDQARRILGTMYNPNDEIGLSVNSWAPKVDPEVQREVPPVSRRPVTPSRKERPRRTVKLAARRSVTPEPQRERSPQKEGRSRRPVSPEPQRERSWTLVRDKRKLHW